MSESRKECYECKYKDNCYEKAVYNSEYCKYKRKDKVKNGNRRKT